MKVSPNISVINVRKVLPISVRIVRAGTHLYGIGLSLYKPYNITKINILFIIRILYCIYINWIFATNFINIYHRK